MFFKVITVKINFVISSKTFNSLSNKFINIGGLLHCHTYTIPLCIIYIYVLPYWHHLLFLTGYISVYMSAHFYLDLFT